MENREDEDDEEDWVGGLIVVSEAGWGVGGGRLSVCK